MNLYLVAIASSLAIVLLLFFLLLSLMQGKSGHKDMSKLYLALLFFEMILLLAPALAQGLGLRLPRLYAFIGSANFFYGSPSLFLFTATLLGKRIERPARLYLPSLINLVPALAFSFVSSIPMRNGYAYFLVIGEILLFIYYARRILRLLSATSASSTLSSGRTLCLRLLACYACYYLLTFIELLASLGQTLSIFGKSPSWLQFLPVVFLFVASGFIAFSIIQELLLNPATHAGAAPKPKYGGAALSKDKAEAILEQARRFLSECADLGDDTASPRAIASALGIPYYLLSRAANERGGRSVADMLNDARIAKAKDLLVEKPGYDLITIAFESGFAAKSSFNACFKRSTGISPSEYRNKSLLTKKQPQAEKIIDKHAGIKNS